jgi:predicted enzyme related to lactoylglutathione lyase
VIEPSRTATGRFCWQDLAAADMAAALRFYGIVFGWTSTVQRANGGCFTRLQSGGHDVASMYPLSDAHLALGVPSHWTPYVRVDQIEDTLRRVHDAGGCVIVQPFTVEAIARIALIEDPVGATLGLWETPAP